MIHKRENEVERIYRVFESDWELSLAKVKTHQFDV